MAGDWIKIEHWTPDKPEVFQIADELQIDPDAVTGKLVRIWIWADQQTTNGNAVSVTRSLLDRVSGVSGFAIAMEHAGWLGSDHDGIWFTNFDRHNGETAKARALTAKRVAKTRNAKRNASVTLPALPREEKRRVYKEAPPAAQEPPQGGEGKKRFIKPTLEEVRAYCSERKNSVDPEQFLAHYESNGWRIGKAPMKNWKAAVVTWEKNSVRAGSPRAGPSGPSGKFSYDSGGDLSDFE